MRVRATENELRPVLPVLPRTESRHRPSRPPIVATAAPPPRSDGMAWQSGPATALLAQELWQRISVGEGPVRPGIHREASLAYRRALDHDVTTSSQHGHFDSLI
ncbi:MAG: hypothetical protein QF893_04745 [Alphaproteobacteria bacterium]|jgi:hypothetical protein|nr:hypothetical protein [Alphaproteobacteria bacterium]